MILTGSVANFLPCNTEWSIYDDSRPTLGFKNFYSAKVTIMGIENIRMIQKGQIIGQTASNASFHNFANLLA